MSNKYGMIVKTLIITTAVSLAFLSCLQEPGCEESRVILRTGQIIEIAGEVDIKKAGEEFWRKASTEMLLSQYDTIRTHPESSVDIEFSKKEGQYFKIRLRDESRLSFTKLEQDTKTTIEDILLDLAIGDVLIKTDKLHRKSKFQVRTPTSMIGVRGTRFEVIYKKVSNSNGTI